jgi:hypothetical protein
MRKGKEELYEKEREDILIKVLKLIGITRERKRINREEMESEEIKEGIKNMLEEIKKYYKISKWRSIKTWKDKEINIITNILKYNGIEIIKTDRKRKVEEKYVHYREFIFDIGEGILNKI